MRLWLRWGLDGADGGVFKDVYAKCGVCPAGLWLGEGCSGEGGGGGCGDVLVAGWAGCGLAVIVDGYGEFGLAVWALEGDGGGHECRWGVHVGVRVLFFVRG